MCACNEYKAISSEKSFSPSLKFINSKLSRYNNQNAGSVHTCHILKCFPYYISSVCCIDMTENWSRQPFIDLPSGMKNCVLTWTELVLHSLPACSDIPEGGKPSLGKKRSLNYHDTSFICYPLSWFSIAFVWVFGCECSPQFLNMLTKCFKERWEFQTR